MLGSMDCMYWRWRNCPVAWAGQYTTTNVNQLLCSKPWLYTTLWIWHCFFGLLGSFNYINVLHRSHLFAQVASGKAPACNYTINRHDYTMRYYLADGIYPTWSTFFKIISDPKIKKNIFLPKHKEHAERILIGYLVWCKLGFPLFEVLLPTGIRNPSGISWLHE